jgi:hypothetical protein
MRVLVKRTCLAALLVLGFAPALAAEPPPAKSAAPKSKLICSKERSTGSNLRRRTCQTEAQREARRKQDQEAMVRMKTPPPANDVSR